MRRETALEQAFATAEEARRELESFLSRLEVDAGELERKEERLFAIRAAARKYAVTSDELPRMLSEFRAKLDAIDGGGAKLKAAEADVTQARRHLSRNRAQALRRRAAPRRSKLEAAVAAELAPLKLGHAKFRVALER